MAHARLRLHGGDVVRCAHNVKGCWGAVRPLDEIEELWSVVLHGSEHHCAVHRIRGVFDEQRHGAVVLGECGKQDVARGLDAAKKACLKGTPVHATAGVVLLNVL